MSENKSFDDGGPAFPVSNEANVNGQAGMSLLDYFAGQETLSDCGDDVTQKYLEALVGPCPVTGAMDFWHWESKWRAKLKYLRATAMLNERERIMQGGK